MKFKEFVKKNQTALKIFAIALIVFAFWMAFSPATTAREGILNWFSGVNTLFIIVILVGVAMIAFGGIPLLAPGIITTGVGVALFYGVGLIQNIFATTNPIVLIILGAIIVWWIMRPLRPRAQTY